MADDADLSLGNRTPVAAQPQDAAQRAREHQLQERIKELSCLYDMTALLNNRTLSPDALAQAFVERIPAAYQYPAVTCARLELGARVHVTSNFAATAWQQQSDVVVNGASAGRLVVGYLEECPPEDEGPFLREERALLDQLAQQLGKALEHRQLQEALARSDEIVRSVLAASPDTIITVDRQVVIHYINRVVAGLTMESVIGQSVLEYIAPAYHETVRSAIEQVFTTGQYGAYEIEGLGPNGAMAWYATRLAPILQDGAVLQVLLIIEDITQRKQAEQALAASELHFRALIENISDGIELFGADGSVIYASPSAARVLGYRQEELLGPDLHLMHPEDLSSAMATLAQALAAPGQPISQAYRARHQDGSWRWLEGTATNLLHEPAVGAVVVNFRDITERKAAEAALAASEERYRQLAAELEQRVLARTAEVQAERDFARQVMDARGQGLVVSDEQHRAEYVNPFLVQLLGTTQAAMLGTMVDDFILPEDLPIVQAVARQYRPEEEYQYELRLLAATGQVIPTLISSSPRLTEGKVVGRIAVLTDLTHIKAIEMDLRQSRDELRSANLALEKAVQLKDEFLATMSHELRTPLTGILGLSEALQMQTYGTLNERQLRAVDSIWQSGQHLLTLINDILDLSKLEAAQFELDPKQCDVGEICRASLALIKGMAQKKQQQIAFRMEPSFIDLVADPRRLKQMLVNLLSNAVKFTPERGALGLRVQGDAVLQVVRFTVWDKGIGIAPENLPRLFQPFTQLDSSLAREYSGSGLGLALVQRMAQLHDGSVVVESTPGSGSTFTLTLPWRQLVAVDVSSQPNDTHPGPEQLPAEAGGVAPAPRPLVLLAEDNSVSAEMLTEFLDAHGYRVEVAHNGLEAVEKAAQLLPALILMDIRMPIMDGFQAMQHIRTQSDPRQAAVPIIALTAQAMQGDAERCIAAGANVYLAKPYRFADLLGVIQAQLLLGAQTP